MATPRMPSLIPRRPKLVHYAFAAVVGWATSYYTFQPLLEQQVSGHFVPARPRMPALLTLTLDPHVHRPGPGQQRGGNSRSRTTLRQSRSMRSSRANERRAKSTRTAAPYRQTVEHSFTMFYFISAHIVVAKFCGLGQCGALPQAEMHHIYKIDAHPKPSRWTFALSTCPTRIA